MSVYFEHEFVSTVCRVMKPHRTTIRACSAAPWWGCICPIHCSLYC